MIRFSTAQTIGSIRPVLLADGITLLDGHTPDIELKKNGGAWLPLSDDAVITQDSPGYFTPTIGTGDANTLGRWAIRWLTANNGAIPLQPGGGEEDVVTQQIYDAGFTTGGVAALINALGTALAPYVQLTAPYGGNPPPGVGPDLYVSADTDWAFSVSGLGNLAGRAELLLTVKREFKDPDSAAVLQVKESVGLLVINGAAATAGDGTLSVTNEADATVAGTVKASAAAAVSPGAYVYDLKWKNAGGLWKSLPGARFNVGYVVTKTIA